MTKQTGSNIVRLSVRDWAGIGGVLVTILSAFFMGTLSIERRLTEVIVRQQQLEVRLERVEEHMDRSVE
tara:strand:+ start:2711 stop:2917 length:207 start_codon:yes stop_codon:yes gene_type:complete